jgi:hypothetical protein
MGFKKIMTLGKLGKHFGIIPHLTKDYNSNK